MGAAGAKGGATMTALILSPEATELLRVVLLFLAAMIALSLFAYRVRP